tara:strand:- start:276 stop:1496 length:1221 start_codon:yes stop_codon:yes gene_type:complete
MVTQTSGVEGITSMFVPDKAKFDAVLKEVSRIYGSVLQPLKTAFNKPTDLTDKSKSYYYLFKQRTVADERRDISDRLNAWFIGDNKIAKFSVLRLVFITLTFVYLPMCTYIITRKGYSVGGTDIDDFPYNDSKTSGSGLLKEFRETYKQLGGAKSPTTQRGGSTGIGPGFVFGPYRTVQFPYTLTAKSYTDYNAFIFFLIWIIESTAGSYCFGRQLLDALLSTLKAMGVGFDPSKTPNQRMMSFAKCFLVAIPLVALIPVMSAVLPVYNMVQLIVRIPNRLWPFVGNRTFSTLFIFMILAITVFGLVAYITALSSTLTVVSGILTLTQVISYSLFFFLSPLFLAGSRDNIYWSAILGPIIKVYLLVLLFLIIILPTNAEFGMEATIGGLIALFSSGGFAYYNSKTV